MENFYNEIVALKKLVRSGWKEKFGKENFRLESDAEHTFSSIFLAMKIISDRKLMLDELKVFKMLLVHEFGEIDAGDITPYDGISKSDKKRIEEEGVKRISKLAGSDEISELWKEFEDNKTKEARFAKVVDKLDTCLQAKWYAEKFSKPEVFAEFYATSKDILVGYEEYLN